jgi:hypothetical protein
MANTSEARCGSYVSREPGITAPENPTASADKNIKTIKALYLRII